MNETSKASVTALLVDDERLARRELRSMLGAHPEVAVVGEAADVAQAVARAAELSPDVVFLDIQMPGASGFELLARLPAACHVVFVTAYSEHAVRAFEVNALDYLLKPVSEERLAATVKRLLSAGEPPRPAAKGPLRYDDPLIFPGGDAKSGKGYQVLRVSEITCIQAARDYSEVWTVDGRRTLVTRSLKDWEERLPEAYFLRVHRGTLVNVEHVARIEPWFNSSFRIHLKKEAEPLVASRRFASKLRERLV